MEDSDIRKLLEESSVISIDCSYNQSVPDYVIGDNQNQQLEETTPVLVVMQNLDPDFELRYENTIPSHSLGLVCDNIQVVSPTENFNNTSNVSVVAVSNNPISDFQSSDLGPSCTYNSSHRPKNKVPEAPSKQCKKKFKSELTKMPFSDYESPSDPPDDSDLDKDYIPSTDNESTDVPVKPKNRLPKGRRTLPAFSTPMKKPKASSRSTKRKPRSNLFSEHNQDPIEPIPQPIALDFDSDPESGPSSSSEEDSSSGDSEDELWVEVDDDDFFPSLPVQFLENVGPKHMPPHNSTPLAYFALFFTTSLIALFVNETNRYAEQFLSTNMFPDGSQVAEWLPVTEPEMKAFIACILNMGLIKNLQFFILVYNCF
ncbi:hypothetical protein J6590_069758 [Homalodisca vitripennis]|nr:hypothetical protein J6590_069758 [Homalodisca vitripennis]